MMLLDTKFFQTILTYTFVLAKQKKNKKLSNILHRNISHVKYWLNQCDKSFQSNKFITPFIRIPFTITESFSNMEALVEPHQDYPTSFIHVCI